LLRINPEFTRINAGALAGGGSHPECVTLGRIDVKNCRLGGDLNMKYKCLKILEKHEFE
jgi:hypothetical protein